MTTGRQNPGATRDAKPTLGLLGGVGAGKSTVAAEFARLGCRVIDGDAIGHQLLEEPAVAAQLRQRWGEAIFGADGKIDRRALAKLVFADARELAALDAILHPLIGAEIARQIETIQNDAAVPAAVLDAAVMVEAGWDRLCTHRIFVDAPDDARRQRVETARGWSGEAWRDREKSQIPLYKKREKCEYTVVNSSCISYLRDQVQGIFNQIVRPKDCSETKR